MPTGRLLGIHEIAVHDDFEYAAARRNQVDLDSIESIFKRGRQTGGSGLVVSHPAVLYRHAHGPSFRYGSLYAVRRRWFSPPHVGVLLGTIQYVVVGLALCSGMNATRLTVRVELLPDHPDFGDPGAAVLAPSRPGDAGIDLIACESVSLAPGERAAVSTGLCIALPDGVEGQVRPRSGRALREGLSVANSPGTIDPGYRGPVKVVVLNLAAAIDPSDLSGPPERLSSRLASGLEKRTIRIERGERIAQLVFARFERPVVEVVEAIDQGTERGSAGFGSTGTGRRE